MADVLVAVLHKERLALTLSDELAPHARFLQVCGSRGSREQIHGQVIAAFAAFTEAVTSASLNFEVETKKPLTGADAPELLYAICLRWSTMADRDIEAEIALFKCCPLNTSDPSHALTAG